MTLLALLAAPLVGLPTVPALPTRATPDMRIVEATQTCRNIEDEVRLRETGVEPPRYSQVNAGERYALSLSPVPGAVYAIPVPAGGQGTSEVRAACFE